jgi:hypothetical protein
MMVDLTCAYARTDESERNRECAPAWPIAPWHAATYLRGCREQT